MLDLNQWASFVLKLQYFVVDDYYKILWCHNLLNAEMNEN